MKRYGSPLYTRSVLGVPYLAVPLGRQGLKRRRKKISGRLLRLSGDVQARRGPYIELGLVYVVYQVPRDVVGFCIQQKLRAWTSLILSAG